MDDLGVPLFIGLTFAACWTLKVVSTSGFCRSLIETQRDTKPIGMACGLEHAQSNWYGHRAPPGQFSVNWYDLRETA